MSYFSWRPYVPVAQRQKQAQKELAKLAKRGESPTPVKVEGRKIAESFWGKSWCENLERYSDFANRLPRGRSYVRNGSVVDLKINKGEVLAMVTGSELYRIKIEVAQVKPVHWKAICRDCAGTVGSWSSSCRAGSTRASWSGCAARVMACSRPRKKSSCLAAARIGRKCASTWRRHCAASARGSTGSPSFFSCCAMSIKKSCWPAPVKISHSPRRSRAQR